MSSDEKCEIYKKVWVDVAPHERTVWKCLDPKPPAKDKKAKTKDTLTVKMPFKMPKIKRTTNPNSQDV